jgi:sporulation protein YlmC with PRC-barrel domain
MNVSELKRKQPTLAVVAAAIAVALGSGLQAQQPQQQPRPQQQAQPQQQPRPQADQQIARSDTGMQTLDQYLQSKSLRVSKVDGMELQTRNGDNLGEVEDVMRGATPGQNMMLLVKIGGIGADSKLIAVPFNEVQINAKGDELYTTRTREQLAAAPAVQPNPTATSPSAADRNAAERGGAAQPPAAGGAAQRGAATTAPSQQRLADLVGADVVGSGGDKVAEVDDIVISTAGADGTRAVLQVGGVAGIGEKRISVPISQVTIERPANDKEPTLRVAMDADALQRLPEYKYDEQTSL